MLRKLISYQSYLKMTCSIRKIAILLSILLFVLSTPVLADIRGTDINGKPVILRSDGTWSYINPGGGDAKTCRDYANRAISQQRNNQSSGCGFAGVRWHLDYNKHYNSCMRSGAQWSVRETNLRQNALNTCSKTGGKTKICQAYANNAIAQQRANLNRGCGFAGGLWHLDYKTHHKWCMLVSAQARGKATNDRLDALNRCTKTPPPPPPVTTIKFWLHAPSGDFSKAHRDQIINYITWNNTKWTAKVQNGVFIHAPNGDFSKAHKDDIINYITWNNTKWTAKVQNGVFIHAPNGDFSKAHKDDIINYITWNNTKWTAKIF